MEEDGTWVSTRGGRKLPSTVEGSLRDLLAGIDLYVVETNKRKGFVGSQAQKYHVPTEIESVAAYTPSDKHIREEVMSIARECKARNDKWEGKNLQFAQYSIGTKAICCTLSHLKALKAACDRKDRQGIALVLEDDASFEPLAWWPEPLEMMLAELPSDWSIVSAAVSNFNQPCEFRKRNYFCRHEGNNHYGSVAVVYNLRSPKVCPMLGKKSPLEFHRSASIMCQPSDMLLFTEFGGGLHNAFSSRMPLFYFSRSSESAQPGAMNNHNSVDAKKQRSSWASYVERRKAEIAGMEKFIPRRCPGERFFPYLLRLNPFRA